jgi:hypothetical protein
LFGERLRVSGCGGCKLQVQKASREMLGKYEPEPYIVIPLAERSCPKVVDVLPKRVILKRHVLNYPQKNLMAFAIHTN